MLSKHVSKDFIFVFLHSFWKNKEQKYKDWSFAQPRQLARLVIARLGISKGKLSGVGLWVASPTGILAKFESLLYAYLWNNDNQIPYFLWGLMKMVSWTLPPATAQESWRINVKPWVFTYSCQKQVCHVKLTVEASSKLKWTYNDMLIYIHESYMIIWLYVFCWLVCSLIDKWINQPGSLEVGRDLPSAGAIAKFCRGQTWCQTILHGSLEDLKV